MPKREREFFVFTKPCGCWVASVLKGASAARDEDHAWREIYPMRGDERLATLAGVRCRLVDQETFSEVYAAKPMGCSHAEAGGTDGNA